MMLSGDLKYWRDGDYFNSREYLQGSRKNLNVTNFNFNLILLLLISPYRNDQMRITMNLKYAKITVKNVLKIQI